MPGRLQFAALPEGAALPWCSTARGASNRLAEQLLHSCMGSVARRVAAGGPRGAPLASLACRRELRE